MKTYCVRKIGFDAGHRVVNHESKCRTFHGHRYTAEIYAEAPELDKLGRVIDFSVIKYEIGGWIDKWWDHAMIIWDKDPDKELIMQLDGMKEPYLLPENPTAENMAAHLLLLGNEIMADLDNEIFISKVRLWETPNCYVEVEA